MSPQSLYSKDAADTSIPFSISPGKCDKKKNVIPRSDETASSALMVGCT